MMVKWISRGLLIAVVGAAVVVSALLVLVDPNDFKPQIISAVRENTGRELTMDGDLHLAFFPYLAVTISGVQLGNSEGFEGPFLTLERAYLKARLIPLLVSRLDVVAVEVDGLSLFLTRDADGKGNWMDLAAPGGQAGTPDKAPDLASDRRVPVLASLIVDGLRVSDARVVWDDRLKGDRYEVSGISLDVSDFAFGEPFDVATGASAKIGDMDASLDFSTKAVLALDRLDLEDLRLTASLSGPNLPQSPENVFLTLDHFSTDGRLENGRMQGLGLDMRFTTRDSSAAASSGSVDVAQFSPKDVAARLGASLPAFAEPSALQRASFSCDWNGTAERIDVSNLRLAVDNSTMQGGISVTDRKKPFVALDLRIDSLDLDRYRLLPGENDGKGGGDPGGEAIVLPVRELRALNGEARLAVGDLKAANVRCTDASVKGRAAGGLLELEEIVASAYDGRLTASASLDVRGDVPVYSWRHDLAGLQIGPLLQALHGRDHVVGTTQGTAAVQTRGGSATLLKRNLSGRFDFRVVNGALNGVNIPKNIRDGVRRLKGEAPTPDEPARTVFSVLSGSGVVDRGVETTRDLLLLAPRFKVTGGGQSDLVREDMDFRLLVTLEGSEGKFDEGVLGLSSFPVRVSGPIRSPTVAPDMDSVLRSLGLQGGKAVEETLKGIGSGLNKGVEGLKRLFQ